MNKNLAIIGITISISAVIIVITIVTVSNSLAPPKPTFEQLQQRCAEKLEKINQDMGLGPVRQFQINLCAGMVLDEINK